MRHDCLREQELDVYPDSVAYLAYLVGGKRLDEQGGMCTVADLGFAKKRGRKIRARSAPWCARSAPRASSARASYGRVGSRCPSYRAPGGGGGGELSVLHFLVSSSITPDDHLEALFAANSRASGGSAPWKSLITYICIIVFIASSKFLPIAFVLTLIDWGPTVQWRNEPKHLGAQSLRGSVATERGRVWEGVSPSHAGGGGTSILKVSGTCRWTGYDFAIIAIKTGCLNQPNHWHRVSKSAYILGHWHSRNSRKHKKYENMHPQIIFAKYQTQVPRRRNEGTKRTSMERMWCGGGVTSNAVSFYYLWYGAIWNDSIPTNTNIDQMYMCMRASGASELGKFWQFYILKLLFSFNILYIHWQITCMELKIAMV